MVRFILGRAGTGKTWHCLAQIEALVRADPLGPPIFLLVPRQATFQAERELSQRLGGFSRVQVASLDDLGRLILEHCGDVGIPQVTAIGRRLVIGHLLRKHEQSLRFYGSCARRGGLAAEIDSTFGELERCGIDPDALDQADHFAPDDPLAGKLRDLALLLRQYNEFIGQGRLDPRRRMELILKRVNDCSLLRHAHVFVDEFYDFGGQELKLLVAVATASARTEISLLMDPDSPLLREPDLLPEDLSLFHRTERTYCGLHRAMAQANVPMEPPLLLRQPQRFDSPTLAGIEQGWFDAAASPMPLAADAVERFTSPDIRAEIDAAARRIRQAISTGIRLREIAVLVREPEQYHSLIDASFAEHDLPYFIDRRRAAVHHPLLQFVRAALLIARHNWPHEMAMALIKTGLAGIDDAKADLLENYVLQHRIRGRMWESPQPWAYRRRLTRQRDQDDSAPPPSDDPTQFDQMRRSLVEKLSPLLNMMRRATATTTPVSDLLRQLLATLEAFAVRLTLERWMREAASAGQHQQRAEHEQVWANFTALLQQMHELLGPELASADDFLAMLDSGLEGFDLAVSPPTLDGILVGQPDRTRTPEVKWTFVLGLNEGSFPRLSRPDCVLNDSERRRLGRHNLELEPDTQRRLLDERLLGYIAVTRASQHLVASRPLADEKGRATNPSAFWLELERLCPGAPLRHEPRAASDPSADPATIGTPRQLTTTLMHWARISHSDDIQQPWPALYQWLAREQDCGEPVQAMRRRAWKALSYTNTAMLSAELGGRLFPSPLAATAGELETFAACPFRHFARYGLQLESRESADVTSLDLSNAYHHVLENLVTAVLRQRQDWCDLPPESLTAMIRTHAAEIGRQLRGELMLSSARNRYVLHRIETTLEEAVAGQCAMHRRGRYRPAFAGVRFGDDQPLPALEVPTPSGKQVRLRGRIDRVDLHPNDATFTVSDYRMRGYPLQLDEVLYGLNLQLLTYLLVLSTSGEALAGRPISPAAGFLLGMLRKRRSVAHPDDALDPADPDFHLQTKPRGIIHRNSIASFDSALESGDSAVVSIFLKKDGSPGNRHRTDLAEAEEFAALLRWVAKRIGQIADQIMSGDIRVRPYMLGNDTPCPTCEFRSVCRFEPTINGYRFLRHLKREEVLERCCAEHGGGDEG